MFTKASKKCNKKVLNENGETPSTKGKGGAHSFFIE